MPLSGQTGSANAAPKSSVLMLQIDRPGNESSLQFPAVVRNLANGIASLEVDNPWTVLNWETLNGLKGCLSLPFAESGEYLQVQGTVEGARYTVLDRNDGRLNLRLLLSDPNPAVQKLILEYIPKTPKDIKGFWNQWEQIRQAPPPATSSSKMVFAVALALLLGGLVLQLAGGGGFKIFSWLLWFCGTLVVAGQTLRLLKSRKASR